MATTMATTTVLVGDVRIPEFQVRKTADLFQTCQTIYNTGFNVNVFNGTSTDFVPLKIE